MIRMKANPPRRPAENTIALINVVFLMLIFFLIAGTLAPSPDRQVEMVSLAQEDPATPPDMLFIRKDGTLSWGGKELSDAAEAAVLLAGTAGDGSQEGRPFRVAPDRELPAVMLIETLEALKAAGVARVVLVTRKDAP